MVSNGNNGAKVSDVLTDVFFINNAEDPTPSPISIPASNNVNTYYNISPYIREYLNFDERQTNWNNNTTTPTAQWCNVQVKRYKLDTGVYTLLDTTSYKAFDGFGYYEQGYNWRMHHTLVARWGDCAYEFLELLELGRQRIIFLMNILIWKIGMYLSF